MSALPCFIFLALSSTLVMYLKQLSCFLCPMPLHFRHNSGGIAQARTNHHQPLLSYTCTETTCNKTNELSLPFVVMRISRGGCDRCSTVKMKQLWNLLPQILRYDCFIEQNTPLKEAHCCCRCDVTDDPTGHSSQISHVHLTVPPVNPGSKSIEHVQRTPHIEEIKVTGLLNLFNLLYPVHTAPLVMHFLDLGCSVMATLLAYPKQVAFLALFCRFTAACTLCQPGPPSTCIISVIRWHCFFISCSCSCLLDHSPVDVFQAL